MGKKYVCLLASLVLLTGLFVVGALQPARAADCGQPPLPPCAGQGVGEDPRSNSEQSPSSSQPSIAPISTIVVSEILAVGTNTDLTIHFRTNLETNAIVTLTDQIQTINPPLTVKTDQEKYTFDHAVVLSQNQNFQFPEMGLFDLAIQVTDRLGKTFTRRDLTLRLKNGQATIELGTTDGPLADSSDTSGVTAGETTSDTRQRSTKTAGQSPADEVLTEFFGQELTPSFTLADLILLLFLILLGLATILEGFFFTKRQRLWGVVYDARTKAPIEMAVIRLFDQEHHKLLETRVTPKSGRFSFLAEPGEYYLDVTKEGYHFPSRIVDGSIDNEYTNLYLGRVIKLGAGQSLIAPDVPIDSEAGEIQKPGIFRRVIIPAMDKFRLPLLGLVFLIALGYQFLFIDPLEALEKDPNDLLLFGSLGLIIILITIEFLFVRRGRK